MPPASAAFFSPAPPRSTIRERWAPGGVPASDRRRPPPAAPDAVAKLVTSTALSRSLEHVGRSGRWPGGKRKGGKASLLFPRERQGEQEQPLLPPLPRATRSPLPLLPSPPSPRRAGGLALALLCGNLTDKRRQVRARGGRELQLLGRRGQETPATAPGTHASVYRPPGRLGLFWLTRRSKGWHWTTACEIGGDRMGGRARRGGAGAAFTYDSM